MHHIIYNMCNLPLNFYHPPTCSIKMDDDAPQQGTIILKINTVDACIVCAILFWPARPSPVSCSFDWCSPFIFLNNFYTAYMYE